VEEKALEELPRVRFFPDLGLLSVRSSWEFDAKAFTIKCSAPGGNKQWEKGWELFREEGIDCLSLSHHHPDNLSYIYAEGKEFLTCEDGYNRNILPANHNVLLVDGNLTDVMNVNDVYVSSAKKRLEADPEVDIVHSYRGDVRKFYTDESITYYQADTSLIYPIDFEMKEVSRTFFTDNLDFIVFVDRFQSDKNHVYSVLSNTNKMAEQEVTNRFRYCLNGKSITYSVYSDNKLVSEQYEQITTGIMTSQEPENTCSSEIKTLSFSTRELSKNALFFECLVPEDIKVYYTPYRLLLVGRKQYEFIAKEGYTQYGICSEASLTIIVSANDTKEVYEV
jgi:hypothetical protein